MEIHEPESTTAAVVESEPAAALVKAPDLTAEGRAFLARLAKRYVWWKTPDEAMLYPGRVAAQVMHLCTWEDLTAMVVATGEAYLRGVLERAEIGQLGARSWHSWHYRLGLAEFGARPVPPMPVRRLG